MYFSVYDHSSIQGVVVKAKTARAARRKVSLVLGTSPSSCNVTRISKHTYDSTVAELARQRARAARLDVHW